MKYVSRLYLVTLSGLIIFCLAEITILKDKIYTELIPPALMFSGTISFMCGVELAKGISKKFREALNHLINCQIIQVNNQDYFNIINNKEYWKNFIKDFDKERNRFGHIIGVIISIIMFLAFLYVGNLAFNRKTEIEHFVINLHLGIIVAILETIGGYVVGYYLGHMIFNGILVKKMSQKKIILNPVPGNIDNFNGIKPLIYFYFYQGIIAAIPALFIGCWWFLMFSDRFKSNWLKSDFWVKPYLVLLTVGILIQLLILIIPFYFLHQKLKEAKKKYSVETDEISNEIDLLKLRLITGTKSNEDYELLKDQIAELTKRYWDIKKMKIFFVDTNLLVSILLGTGFPLYSWIDIALKIWSPKKT